MLPDARRGARLGPQKARRVAACARASLRVAACARASLRVAACARASLLVAWALALPAAALGARLEYHGHVLTTHQVETLFGGARAINDSAGAAAGLARLAAALQDQGYLEAQVRAERALESAVDSAGGGVWRVVVDEGTRIRLAAVRLETSQREDSIEFGRAFDVAPGGWVSPRAIADAVGRAVDAVGEQGYPYAQLGVTALDWDSAGARLRLNGALGPAVTVTNVRLDGLSTTRPSVVKRAMGDLSGTRYSHLAAEAAADRLRQLGLFRTVSYDGLESHGDWSEGELVYRIEEPHYNSFEGVLGVQSQRTVVGLARVELGNLAGTGRTAGLHWQGDGPGLQEFDAHYGEPMLFGLPLKLELALRQQLQDTLYTRNRWGARLQFRLEPRRRLELSYEQERVITATGDASQAASQITGAALETDQRDDPVIPRHGLRARVEGGQSFKTEDLRAGGKRKAQLTSARALLEWHRPLGAAGRTHSGLAWELSGVGRFSSQRVLADYERFPLGGATSLRGFDEQQFIVDRYALSRLEWRYFLGVRGQRVHLFWDHAEMATRTALASGGDRLEARGADGVGFGLRLETAAGLVGIDYALEPGRAPLEGKIHLQLVTYF